MSRKRTIVKLLLISVWIICITGITMLLIAANKKSEEQVCSGVIVEIRPDLTFHYVSSDDVLLTIEETAKTTLVNRAVSSMPLQQMEKALEANEWIRDAQLYVDSKNELHVIVEERRPIARFINTAGVSFYVDEEATPLSFVSGKPIRLPVVTGISSAKKWSARDTLLFHQAVELVKYISTNAFWTAQVGQVDINVEGNFEIIPVVGDHVVKLGTGYDVEQKLEKLYLFYKNVLASTGFNKYSVIDVQYSGQVVARKSGTTTKIDSGSMNKTIEEFLQQREAARNAEGVHQLDMDSIHAEPGNTAKNIKPATDPETDNKINTVEKPLPSPTFVPVKTTTHPIKTTTGAHEKPDAMPAKKVSKKQAVPDEVKPPQPKAVMPKREAAGNDNEHHDRSTETNN